LKTLEKNYKLEQKITPLLVSTKGVAGKTKEAIDTYTNIFPHSKIEMLVPYTKDDGDKEGFIKHSRVKKDLKVNKREKLKFKSEHFVA
jgi:predicted 3-demethylubiquinone-9 3-methyltransferase (glyoxalase superfamily)